jgi:hypothetical protein
MTRGNQRDLDRLARQKKEEAANRGVRGDGKALTKAKEDDAAIMRAKQAAAAAKRGGGGGDDDDG